MDGASVTVRRLEKADFTRGFIESLENLSFPVKLTPAEAAALYEKIDGNPVYRMFVAESDGAVVGVVTLLIEQKFFLGGIKFGYLEDMSVRKGFERRGIGKKLVAAAIEEAKKEKCACIRLDCNDETAPFYEKSGFKKKSHVNRMQINLEFVSPD